MKLVDTLSEETIRIPLQNTQKEKIIAEMVDMLYAAGKIQDREVALKAVLEREKIMSTGVGDGVAIPHSKADGVKEIVTSFGITKEDVDFAAVDNKPVRLLFLLVGPKDVTGPHLKALSRISRLTHNKDFRQRLIDAKSAHEVLEVLRKEEAKYFDL